ncbi:MAG: ATP-binding cassette domain-containing protein [Acholeplasmatales bacterium]|nr:ATP-binding cassette domain-containing protein [Acholeplasmatales bacterium]
MQDNKKEILLSLRNVSISFKDFKAVNNASLDIYKGEIFSLVGESGSGKTTLGRAIIRINSLKTGEILFNGQRISGDIDSSLNREIKKNIQMVFQDPSSSLNERATVDYIISEGLYNFNLFENEDDRIKKVENIISEVGLLHEHISRYPHEFSGGQRQRIGIARAMVMEPKLLIADEPISALDVSIRAQILNLLKKFQKKRNLTTLFIAHDLSIVRFISDRIGVIYKGDIVEIAEAEELFNYPLHPYTKSLISAIPIPDPLLEKKKVLFTYDSSIHDYSINKPKLVDIGNNHFVYGNDVEIEEYKKIRESNIPIIVNKFSNELEDTNTSSIDEFEEIEIKKGNKLLYLISLLMPPVGLFMIPIYKKNENYNNYLLIKKGTTVGFISLGIIITLILFLSLIVSIR